MEYQLTSSPKYRGERNNNPFNIIKSKNQWMGKCHGTDDRFETFTSPLYGIRAGARLIKNYYNRDGIKTIFGIFSKFAPPNENNTIEYAKFVAHPLGIDIHDIFDLEKSIFPISKSIITMECTRCIYPDGLIQQAIEMA